MAQHSFTSMAPVIRLDPPSRARSRSPERKTQFSAHVLDPLLSNLSPESTLQALSAVDALRAAPGSAHEILTKSIANVSATDRAFGIRAALAAQKLKEWYREVRGWQWPARPDAGLGKGFLAPLSASDDTTEGSYLGSLPIEVAIRHESRIDKIKDDMDALDVDELKEHVLDQHIPVRSRPGSSSSAMSQFDPPLSYFQLSDFSAVITATILHALPILSRLNVLLERWNIRLRVLRLIPGLRSGLSLTQSAIDVAMDRVNRGLLPDTDDTSFSKESFAAARNALENNVLRVGAQMDTILDFLEGHEDALPESWIDEMEAIESKFATWAALAEEKALQNAWISKLKLDTQSTKTDNHNSIDDKGSQIREPTLSKERMDEPSNEVSTGEFLDEQSVTQSLSGSQSSSTIPYADGDTSTTNALDESTMISESDLTQSMLTASSSFSSVASQVTHAGNPKSSESDVESNVHGAVPSSRVSDLPHIPVEGSAEHDTSILSNLHPEQPSKEDSEIPEIESAGEIHRAGASIESSGYSDSGTQSNAKHNNSEVAGSLLRRTLSSASLLSQQHAASDRPEKSLRDRYSENRASADIARATNVSPLVFPDSPPPPAAPLNPTKRSNRLGSKAIAPSRKPPRPKHLEPALEIAPSKTTSKRGPPSPTKKHEDQLDERINSILTTIPARIHLASENSSDSDEPPSLRRTSSNIHAASTSSSPSSVRSSTPTPSLTLTRTRRSRTHADDSSVKVYHLHRGGKTVPTKLFVRTVGENGERVMVRVGGGWADLGEYLREYVMHHGRRKVMEDKFEIKGIPSRNTSSNYPSPGRLTPTPGSGRTTPVPRPGSAFDIRRPSSALSVRKTRRFTGTEDPPQFRGTNFHAGDHAIDDPDSPPTQRRLSVSSSFSMDRPTTPSRPTTPKSGPLGLAGPKPRSRNVSMSPESEAWVEGVMGEARKKTAPLKPQFSSGTLRNLPTVAENDGKSGQKLRSVSDIGGGGNRRVYLRGLGK